MDQSLAYLHEILSNYIEDHQAIRDLDERLMENQFASEGDFVRTLAEEESRILTEILRKEMHHANESGDFERVYQLNEVNELLY